MNVGIIGAGHMGRVHGDTYKQLDDAQLVGIASRGQENANTYAEEYHCTNYPEAEVLIKHPAVDVIDICLPTYLHEPYVMLAASHGKHILCAKPFTLTMESADRMVEAVRKADVKFMITQVARFWPELIKIKEFYDTGSLGKVKVIYMSHLNQFPKNTWVQDVEKSGGALFELHIHAIDYIRYLMGPVHTVYATGQQDANGAWNHVVSVLHCANGAKAIAEGSQKMPAGYPSTITLRVVGDQGTADFMYLSENDMATNNLVVYREGQSPEVIDLEPQNPYLNEIAYFLDCVRHDREPEIITPEQSREVLKLVNVIKASLESGEVIHVSH